MEPNKGQRIIYFDQWYTPRAHDLYFLCHVDRLKDPIWWGIGTPNKDLVDQIPNYAAFEKLHAKQQLTNDSILFLSGPSAVHSHTPRKARKATRTIEVYARNFSKIQDLFGEPQRFYEQWITTLRLGPNLLRLLLAFRCLIDWIWKSVKYFLVPILFLPFADLFFVFLKFREFLRLQSSIQKKKWDIKNSRELAMYQNKSLSTFEKELKEELKGLLRESDEAWSNLLQSSRATLTLLVAVAALIVTTMFNEMDRVQSQETEARLRQNIEELEEERDAWKDKYMEGSFEKLELLK